jgi:PAS domain S-box-containing protein
LGLRSRLEAHRQAIAEKWYAAIANTCYAAKSGQQVRQELYDLTGRVMDLLVEASPDGLGQDFGVALGRLHYLQAEALGQTLRVLGQELYDVRPEEGTEQYLSRLAQMLGGIATGFFDEACKIVLTEQETIRAALVTEIEQSHQALRQAHDTLEQRVKDRTADLARINVELRAEVAERLSAEAALRESEEKYRRLVEDMSEVVYVVDGEGYVSYVSPSIEALLGYRPEELIGRRYAQFVYPDDQLRIREAFGSVLAGLRQTNEYRLLTKSGDIRWTLTSSNPTLEGSRVAGVHGLLADISERKQAQEALKASEERWRFLVENAPVLVVTIGSDFQVRYINRAPAELLYPGRRAAPQARDRDSEQEMLPADDIVGVDMLGFVAPDYRAVAEEAMGRVLKSGRGEYLELEVLSNTRRDAWYAVHMAPLSREGQVAEVMLVTWDITEQRRMVELKDNLIRDVSHELRTPLAKVQMSLELLVEMLEDEGMDRERAIRVSGFAVSSAKRLLQTVENILDLSRLEAGVWAYEHESIQPRHLVHEAVLYAVPQSMPKDLEVTANLPESLPEIRGDRVKLFRVLRNLLDNAIKYSDDGRIVITAEERDGELIFAVSDQGYGILPENLENVFERFFQEKTRHLGAGLGLAICRAIVEDHGGRIWAESSGQGQGTTIRFTVPTAGRGEGNS